MSKTFLYLIIGSVLIFKGLGNDLLFSKFHQSDYKIKDYRMEMKSFNKTIHHQFALRTFKFNRSTAAINLTLSSKIGWDGKKLEAVSQLYKFASNEYRIFPIRFQVNVWKAFNANLGGLKSIFKCGNISVEPFYFKKDVVYHSCNMVPDQSHLPPYIPVGRYMSESTLIVDKVQHAVMLLFAEAYQDIVFRD